MSAHPSYGPFTPDKFAELVAAPAGVALKEIRKVDPSWGLPPLAKGERRRFKVKLRRTVPTYEIAMVEVFAADREEAERLAEREADAPGAKVTWHYDDTGEPEFFDVIDVVPA